MKEAKIVKAPIKLADIKEPIHPGSAPYWPTKIFVDKELRKETVFYKARGNHTAGLAKDFKLLDILKNIPAEVKLDDVVVSIKRKNSYYSSTPEIRLGTVEVSANPKYIAVEKKYREDLAKYKIKLRKWRADHKKYQAALQIKDKYQKLFELKAQAEEAKKAAKSQDAKVAALEKAAAELGVEI